MAHKKWFKGFIILFYLLKVSNAGYSQVINKDNTESFKYWVNNSWLVDHLAYDTTYIYKNKLHVVLSLNCDTDCFYQWSYIKEKFESFSNLEFEEYLLNKSSFLLEKSIDSLIIEVYNKTLVNELPCFYRGIVKMQPDTIQLQTADCKDVFDKLEIEYNKINPIYCMNNIKVSEINEKTDILLNSLCDSANSYFQSKKGAIVFNKISQSNSSIIFEIRNLENEVINHKALGSSIEILRFTISCSFQSDEILFNVSLNGKYGSKLIPPLNQNGYIDMEIERVTELETYLNIFTFNKLELWLR